MHFRGILIGCFRPKKGTKICFVRAARARAVPFRAVPSIYGTNPDPELDRPMVGKPKGFVGILTIFEPVIEIRKMFDLVAFVRFRIDDLEVIFLKFNRR